jgi:hypothetical protein
MYVMWIDIVDGHGAVLQQHLWRHAPIFFVTGHTQHTRQGVSTTTIYVHIFFLFSPHYQNHYSP